MSKSKIISLTLIIFSFFIGLYFYSRMPELMASHWDEVGNVNGYMPKFWGLFLMPLISIGLYLLFIFLPKTDPYRKNFKQFENYFNNFVLLVFVFLFYLYLITIAWNLGFRFEIFRLLSPAFAALFYYAGVLTSVAKRNWFVGIRTPWTMSSEIVWNHTHRLGGRLFKIVAFITLFGVIFPKQGVFLLLAPVLLTVITVFVYSYLDYRKNETNF